MNPNSGNSFAAWLGRIPFGDNAGSGHNWNGLLSNTDAVFAHYSDLTQITKDWEFYNNCTLAFLGTERTR